MDQEKLNALGASEESDLFAPTEQLALRYAVAMSQTPVEVPDELFDALHKEFSNKQLVELSSAIAWENYLARFDHAFGIESEGFSDGAECNLPNQPSE